MSEIIIRPPQNAAEIRNIENIQRHTWQMADLSIMPGLIMQAIEHAGGLILCAFDDTQMVGFALSFQGTRYGKRLHWSHMTGILPDYQRRGIGYQLKMAQRQHVLEQGFDTIAWTYDPMRKANAVFNLAALGAKVVDLHPEHYGKMDDGINRGLLSDRFEVHWHLKNEPPPYNVPIVTEPDQPAYALRMIGHEPHMVAIEDQSNILVELPAKIDAFRHESPELAHRWYYALRDAFFTLRDAHYQIDGVCLPTPETFAYVFQREPVWYMYVVKCQDGSFYTGISTDVERRIEQHNAGKGAKYTAARRPVQLMAAWQTYGRAAAQQLEYAFKQLPRSRKLSFIHDQGAAFKDAPRSF